jgi:hypothetical protein
VSTADFLKLEIAFFGCTEGWTKYTNMHAYMAI